MPLWGTRDLASGNQKPIFANTSNAYSNSTINSTVANTNAYYGNMVGVSAAERAAAVNPNLPAHAGWNSQKIGTGPIKTIEIVSGGQGYNTAGFLSITDGSALKQGAGANISYTIANAQNTMQSSSSNARNNTISTLAIVDAGSGFSNVDALTVTAIGSNIAPATFRVTLGGRAGRVHYETIVAMGSITGDDPRDNTYFSGV